MSALFKAVLAVVIIGAFRLGFMLGRDEGRIEHAREVNQVLRDDITRECARAWIAACDGGAQ